MLQADGITYEIETPDGPLKLLDNVSFNVPRGHFMAVVGPSGCGKTTLLKAIAGMIAETDGRFFWNGHDLAEEDFEPSEIGFVPQFSIAYDQLSVDENVESAARLRCRFDSVDDLDDSIDNALEVTGMEGIADRDVKILSGGQKRRLALAMELVSNPRLLICDEVTSGLDPRSEHDIVDLLHEISRIRFRRERTALDIISELTLGKIRAIQMKQSLVHVFRLLVESRIGRKIVVAQSL